MPAPRHTPVLLKEVLESLAPATGETLLDCTAGLGGHAAAIAPRLAPGGRVILNDHDPRNLSIAGEAVRAAAPGVEVVELRGNFAEAPRRLVGLGLAADMLLADLGFSSNQMEDPSRGLSFMRDGPLDMRLDPGAKVTAADLVNTLPEEELGEVIRDYGEERHWRRITQKIVAERARAPITTTARLAEAVRTGAGGKGDGSRIDPATRTFQALRIAVNDELGSLRSLLESAERAATVLTPGAGWLRAGARLVVISFHSLEDRMVKECFARLAGRGIASATKKPVEAGPQELASNPRARSAKLRALRLTVDNKGPGAQVV
jgi:16S rRNA (cytosine1402-N4)-methyltransferase